MSLALFRGLDPSTLLAAIWLQFALAVSGNRAYQNCKECGRWFEVSPEKARKSKLFCSQACRSKAYRERQSLARQMHQAGKTFEAIAQELGSDADTVKNWVT